ncbi:MAG TPA: GNAT family N-acetyltransferase [Firmicutes bacterium]|jgi:predicted N-acetyltransferase YhbS|nr:GNAT family N-acetyltransferase [Bacillota bacterium]
MNLTIRLEEEKDYQQVEYETREAFWDVYRPGCVEHWIVHQIRKAPAFVKGLNYVACVDGSIVGNIMYSKAKVVDDKKQESEVLCMGPLSVLPAFQRKGIGSLLMNHSMQKARELGFKAIVIFGNPHYYGRFGFINAEEYGIQTSSGENFEVFMVLELFAGALKGITGKFYEDKVFEVQDEELEAFEKEFPYKEKHSTDTQLK